MSENSSVFENVISKNKQRHAKIQNAFTGRHNYYLFLSFLFASVCYFLITRLMFFFNILVMFLFFFCMFVFYFAYSAFLCCFVHCFFFRI